MGKLKHGAALPPNRLPPPGSAFGSTIEPGALALHSFFVEGEPEPALVEGGGKALFDVNEN